MSKYNVGNIFDFSCVGCEYSRHCYGGNLGNQYRFCQKSKEKLYSFDELQQANKNYKEVIDKAISHLDLFISDTGLSKYDTLKILMHTKKILKEVE